jgi:hypothetical protein
MRKAFLVVALLLCTAAEARQRAVRGAVWRQPQCTSITGLPGMRFAIDGVVTKSAGITINRRPAALALGLAPNQLYAVFESSLYESRDAGCTWKVLVPSAIPSETPSEILVSKAGLLVHSRAWLTRISGDQIEVLRLPREAAKIAEDPADAQHLRAITWYGEVLESFDRGVTWAQVSDITEDSLNSVAFDPSDFSHILVGGLGAPLHSYDGGRTWTRATIDARVDTWTVEFSPVDPKIVWALARPGSGSDRAMRLYRSTDGGTTFRQIATSSLDIPLNSDPIVPHPREADRMAIPTWFGIVMVTGTQVTLDEDVPLAYNAVWSPAGVLYFAGPDGVCADC